MDIVMQNMCYTRMVIILNRVMRQFFFCKPLIRNFASKTVGRD